MYFQPDMFSKERISILCSMLCYVMARAPHLLYCPVKCEIFLYVKLSPNSSQQYRVIKCTLLLLFINHSLLTLLPGLY
uniref:Uncharacterized protein n=1 Tax=Gasterosteus aculeatus TaxID=69293 RepID=G3NNQ3_GASAC